MPALWNRPLIRLMIAIIGFVSLLYLGDWIVIQLRVTHGTAYRTVQVSQFLATPLKGNKVEYDLMGTFPETCSRSIFPQKKNSPCWWVERHKTQWE